jgi:hypothetical protein
MNQYSENEQYNNENQYYIFTMEEIKTHKDLINIFYLPRHEIYKMMSEKDIDEKTRDLINIKEILGSYSNFKKPPNIYRKVSFEQDLEQVFEPRP